VAEELLRHPRVGIAVLTARVQLGPAGPTRPARDGEWDDDAVAHRQRRAVDPGAHLDDLAHELVAEDVAVLHRRHVAVDQMQVRAADRR